MWLFTKHGFFSATISPTKQGHMQLRARLQEDLVRLEKAMPILGRLNIIETKLADYRWRVVMTPSKFTVLLMHLAEDIDYGNFKNACADNGLDTRPHHQVWSIMHREQRNAEAVNWLDWDREALPGIRSTELAITTELETCPECNSQQDDYLKLQGHPCPECCGWPFAEDGLGIEGQELPDWMDQEGPQDDGQCPDCRTPWMDTPEGISCPHCGQGTGPVAGDDEEGGLR